jgi:hypothetical protein
MSIVADWTEDFSGALQCAANGFAISHTPDDRQPPGPGQFTARVWVNEAANGLRPILPNTGCILEMTEPKACAAFGCNHAAAAGGLCAGCHVKYRSHYWRMERLMRRAQKLMSKVREDSPIIWSLVVMTAVSSAPPNSFRMCGTSCISERRHHHGFAPNAETIAPIDSMIERTAAIAQRSAGRKPTASALRTKHHPARQSVTALRTG